MNAYESFVDTAVDFASQIDNKPDFAYEYMAEGIDQLKAEYSVSNKLALDAIVTQLETREGKREGKRAARQLK